MVQKRFKFANKRNLLFGQFNLQQSQPTTKNTSSILCNPTFTAHDITQNIAIIGAGIEWSSFTARAH